MLTQPKTTELPRDGESLIRRNGEMVEELYQTEAWREIVLPLLQEGVASVSGRFTNGRFHHGDLTRSNEGRDFLAGYQKGLMDLNNRIHDFVAAKDNLIKSKKEEALAAKQPMVNPFMEDQDE